jgi:hypothetical protein
MAVMIVSEVSDSREREFELNREHLQRMKALTGLDETAICTKLNSGEPLEGGSCRWVVVRQ